MIGSTIGNFKITSELGRGGMGEVYLAEQTAIGTRAAIKILQQAASNPDMIQRFFNEAIAVSKIQHAGIVKIFDVGTFEGRAYLVMEYLDGESLTSRIKRGALDIASIANVGRQIASVLDATHAAGITHRDLKPDNIFLVKDQELGERVKILDFGIAKLTGTVAGTGPKTIGAMGTPDYMAPEQWGDAGKVDHRADIYSLGCVIFEMTTGRTPFQVSTIADACNKHMNVVPPGLRTIVPAVPPPLEALVARMLAKKLEMRPQSMADVGKAFEVVARAAPATMATAAPGRPALAGTGAPGTGVPYGTPQHGSQPNVMPGYAHPTPMHPTPAQQPFAMSGQPVAAFPQRPGSQPNLPVPQPYGGPMYPRPGSQPNLIPGARPMPGMPPQPRKSRVGLIVGLSIGSFVLLLVILGAIGAAHKNDKKHATCEEAIDHAAAHSSSALSPEQRGALVSSCEAAGWSESIRDCLAESDDPDSCEKPDSWAN